MDVNEVFITCVDIWAKDEFDDRIDNAIDQFDEWINNLKQFKNIIFKFGRYKPNNNKHYDNVLGINLISDNQYGLEIS